MSLTEALAVVTAAGYRVSKPRTVCCDYHRSGGSKKLSCGGDRARNAIGKPFSPSFDPNYRMKYRAGSTAHLFKPYGSSMKWVQS